MVVAGKILRSWEPKISRSRVRKFGRSVRSAWSASSHMTIHPAIDQLTYTLPVHQPRLPSTVMEVHPPTFLTKSIEDLFSTLEDVHRTVPPALIAPPTWPTELPKAMEPERMSAGFVYRKVLGALWKELKDPVRMRNKPGPLLSNCRRSYHDILTLSVTPRDCADGCTRSGQISHFVSTGSFVYSQKKYVVICIPRADDWNRMTNAAAVLYFADRVHAALVAAGEEVPTFLQVPPGLESWRFVDTQRISPPNVGQVMMMLSKIRTRRNNPVPVIFAIGEVNGLTPDKKNTQSWSTAYFLESHVVRFIINGGYTPLFNGTYSFDSSREPPTQRITMPFRKHITGESSGGLER
ncbi:hypothetical protein DFS34DRAFT_25741 [Phlyctochytrium arcticum]|nr:hypothetical protein DFS34DRAFT_25741 [Phlyctochytrium arcticum]